MFRDAFVDTLCALGLDIVQGFIGGFEREHLVDDGADRAFFDETGNLVQLGAVRLHEKDGIRKFD